MHNRVGHPDRDLKWLRMMRIAMNMEQPFDIVIEGPINNGDGKARQRKKRLNCTCVISDKNPSKQPKLLVKEVTADRRTTVRLCCEG
jgi:hypothetical protein